MPSEFTIVRQVEFSETDMAGIMHFSNFFRYMEAAEHAFFRSLGFSIHGNGPGQVGWPRVHADCDYSAPLCFEDSVEVKLIVRERGSRSIRYDFIFRKLNEEPAREVARGTLTVVCVRRNPETGALASVQMPEAIAEKIEAAQGEQLAQ